MVMKIEIRKAGFDDVSKLAEIKILSWRKNYANIFDKKILFGKLNEDSQQAKILNRLQDNENFEIWCSVTDQGEIVAYALIKLSNKKNGVLTAQLGELFSISSNKNVMVELLNFCKKHLKENSYKYLRTFCFSEYLEGVNFHTQCGAIILNETVNVSMGVVNSSFSLVYLL